ncbi:MAG: hypothetical protein CM15mP84_06730 [Cellvibrionales bacterium]|nr:MAG: hypothetical protein CM15mP84_06730 [Cellvibrionales bacterium]
MAVTVGGLGADEVARVDAGVAADGRAALLGMRLEQAEPAALAELGLSGGVLIKEVIPGSPLRRRAFRPTISSRDWVTGPLAGLVILPISHRSFRREALFPPDSSGEAVLCSSASVYRTLTDDYALVMLN